MTVSDLLKSVEAEYQRVNAELANAQQQLADTKRLQQQLDEVGRQLRAALEDAAQWKQKCETMAAHPDVIDAR